MSAVMRILPASPASMTSVNFSVCRFVEKNAANIRIMPNVRSLPAVLAISVNSVLRVAWR